MGFNNQTTFPVQTAVRCIIRLLTEGITTIQRRVSIISIAVIMILMWADLLMQICMSILVKVYRAIICLLIATIILSLMPIVGEHFLMRSLVV